MDLDKRFWLIYAVAIHITKNIYVGVVEPVKRHYCVWIEIVWIMSTNSPQTWNTYATSIQWISKYTPYKCVYKYVWLPLAVPGRPSNAARMRRKTYFGRSVWKKKRCCEKVYSLVSCVCWPTNVCATKITPGFVAISVNGIPKRRKLCSHGYRDVGMHWDLGHAAGIRSA